MSSWPIFQSGRVANERVCCSYDPFIDRKIPIELSARGWKSSWTTSKKRKLFGKQVWNLEWGDRARAMFGGEGGRFADESAR
jgi:hypothetical protein